MRIVFGGLRLACGGMDEWLRYPGAALAGWTIKLPGRYKFK